jgi:hypothetical protein
VILASGTGFGIFFLARWLFSDRVGFWAVVLAALTPLFAVGATLKYRDPFSGQVPEDTGQGNIRSGGKGHRGGAREIDQGETRVTSRGRKANASRQELDE